MGVSRNIKARIDYSGLSHPEFAVFVESVHSSLSTSPYFPKLPVRLSDLRAKIDGYRDLITAAIDSTQAMLDRNSARKELALMIEQIGYYVTDVANGDAAIFETSGLQAIPTSYAVTQPLTGIAITKLVHAENSGAVKISYTPALRKIKVHQISVREADSELPPESGRLINRVGGKGPLQIDGLTPGKRYVFQVRGQNDHGFSDWSEPVSIICV
jgi:hypothetical protein